EMFRRDRVRDRDRNRDQNGFPPCGHVRVLVVGDSGVGKSSIVHLIVNGTTVSNIQQTVGCNVGIKFMTYGGSGSSSSTSSKGEKERDFFVEMWDVCGHERYKDCRSLFYSQINGLDLNPELGESIGAGFGLRSHLLQFKEDDQTECNLNLRVVKCFFKTRTLLSRNPGTPTADFAPFYEEGVIQPAAINRGRLWLAVSPAAIKGRRPD
ncbi:hypothetical protein KI387_003015, partial [Taxus chinensis]